MKNIFVFILRVMSVLLVAYSLLGVTAPATGAYPQDGDQICVSGAGTASVNGTYTFNAAPAHNHFDKNSGGNVVRCREGRWQMGYYEYLTDVTCNITDPALNGGVWSIVSVPGALLPTPTVRRGACDEGGKVGVIALKITNPIAGLWTGVQWKDPQGKWHDVESWFLPYDESGYGWTPHWIWPEHLSTGPYRWVVYQGKGGPVWATSAEFYFPAKLGDWVWTTITEPNVTPTPVPTPKKK